MSESNLDFAINTLPGFIGESRFTSFGAVIRTLWDVYRNWSHLVSEPRVMRSTAEGAPIWHVQIGRGDRHTVIDAIAHAGEPFWVMGAPLYAMFLCEHPWLLKGRTVHLLFTDPIGAAYNLRRWAIRSGLLTPMQLAESIYGHWRHPVITRNDCWALRLDRGRDVFDNPTDGALAAMQLMEEIVGSGGILELWVSGHNAHIGLGVYFNITGPAEDVTAPMLEWIAQLNDVPLETGPPDSPYQLPHVNSRASWTDDCAADALAAYPSLDIGGSARDYGVLLNEDITTQSTEIAMFLPGMAGPWDDHITWGEANRRAAGMTSWLRGELEHISDIAGQLEATDRFVSATQGINLAPVLWGTDRSAERDPGEVIGRGLAFRIMCRDTLYLARRGGPALKMLRMHHRAIRALGHNPNELRGMLIAGMYDVICQWWLHLKPQDLGSALSVQILAAEASAHYAHVGAASH